MMAGFAHLIPTHLPHLAVNGNGSGGSGNGGTGGSGPGTGSGPSQVTSGGS